MSNLFLTLVIAFVIIVLAIASLAIGWLITGKTKIERGSCGRDPTKPKDDHCQSVCNLCTTSPEGAPCIAEEGDEEDNSESAPSEEIHFSPKSDDSDAPPSENNSNESSEN